MMMMNNDEAMIGDRSLPRRIGTGPAACPASESPAEFRFGHKPLPCARRVSLAHRVAVPSFQSAENARREQSHPSKHEERPLDAMNELWAAGSMAIGNKERRHQTRRSDPETDSHLLNRARDGAALLSCSSLTSA